MPTDYLVHHSPDIRDKNWAHSHYLSLHVLSEAEKARKQLERIMEGFKLELVSSMSDQRLLHERVRQVLVCGFFMQVAHHEGGWGNYVTIKDNQVLHFTLRVIALLKHPYI